MGKTNRNLFLRSKVLLGCWYYCHLKGSVPEEGKSCVLWVPRGKVRKLSGRQFGDRRRETFVTELYEVQMDFHERRGHEPAMAG